ncbi:MAG: hypothetical protein Q9218_003962 [Villophora microphyllina]
MLLTDSILLVFATTATALPQWSGFPGWPIGGGGTTSGGSTGTTGTTAPTGSSSNTANDVTNKAPCKAITVIFARGTGESGNIGSVIGPKLLSALQAKVGAAKGNSNQGGTGGALMTSLAQQALQQCPSTKIVLSGYSQGGFVVHKAGSSLSATPPAAAVIFGDPQNGSPVANVPAADLKEYCAAGDGVCGTPRTYQITAAHLSYGNNASDAANFISTVTGVTA